MADGELTCGNHALGLEADVQENLVLVDLDHFARNDVSVLEGNDGLVDRVLERQFAEVVLDDLAGNVDPIRVEGPMTLLVCGEVGFSGARSVGHWK